MTTITLDKAIEIYQLYDEELGYEHRGYPACVGELEGVVAIADVADENGSSLEMHAGEVFIQWMTKALEFQSEHDTELWEAVGETRPKPGVETGH
jgi:hypothetical protein